MPPCPNSSTVSVLLYCGQQGGLTIVYPTAVGTDGWLSHSSSQHGRTVSPSCRPLQLRALKQPALPPNSASSCAPADGR